MADSTIIGKGNPNGVYSGVPGQKFVDIEGRNEYRQNNIPFGSTWELIASNIDVSLYDPNVTSAKWGGITGTISDQADLQSALNAKQNSLTNGTATNQYLNWTGSAYSPKQIAFSELSGNLASGQDYNTTVSAGTYQGISINAQGRVTSASDQGYATLASPTFTGDPKAPTPTTGDNDTSIATTAFVQNTITALNLATTYFPLAGGALAGTGGNGYVGFPTQSSSPSNPANGFRFYANNSGNISWVKSTAGVTRTLADTATASRTWTLPDVSGVIPVISGTMATNQVGYWSSTNQITSSSAFTYNGSKLSVINPSSGQTLAIGTANSVTRQAYVSFFYNTSTEVFRFGLNANNTNGQNGFGLYDVVNNSDVITYNYQGLGRIGFFTASPSSSYGTTFGSPIGALSSVWNAPMAEFTNTNGGTTVIVSLAAPSNGANTGYALKVATSNSILSTSWVQTRLTLGNASNAPAGGKIFNIKAGLAQDASGTEWNLTGKCIVVDDETYLSNLASNATGSSSAIHVIGQPTINSTNTNITYPDYGGIYLKGDPIGIGGVTLTRAYAFWNAGKSRLDGNISLFGAPSFGGGTGVAFIANASVNPSSTPSGGGILYVDSGALKYKGSSGTVTTIASA